VTLAFELEYYKEQLEHGRHIEVQRSSVAAFSATVAAALIGDLLKNGILTRAALPCTVTLTMVGLIAWLLSAKLYERFRLHNTTAGLVRDDFNIKLKGYRKQAQEINKKKFPLMFGVRLHVIWNCLFALIAVVGFGLTMWIFIHR